MIYKWSIFHSYVKLPEAKFQVLGIPEPAPWQPPEPPPRRLRCFQALQQVLIQNPCLDVGLEGAMLRQSDEK